MTKSYQSAGTRKPDAFMMPPPSRRWLVARFRAVARDARPRILTCAPKRATRKKSRAVRRAPHFPAPARTLRRPSGPKTCQTRPQQARRGIVERVLPATPAERPRGDECAERDQREREPPGPAPADKKRPAAIGRLLPRLRTCDDELNATRRPSEGKTPLKGQQKEYQFDGRLGCQSRRRGGLVFFPAPAR